MTLLIVGGGPAGLLAAWRAAQAGHAVTLFEASERLGGQLAPLSLGPVTVDAAAESFATRSTELPRLLSELGLADDIVAPAAGPAWLFSARGDASPLPATSLLGIPGDPAAGDVAALIGTPAALRARLDAALPASLGADATTLGELVRARMGRVVVDRLVTPVVRGVHSRSPYELPLAAAHPRLAEEFRSHGSLSAAVRALRTDAPAGAAVASLRGGMFRLAHALEQAAREAGAMLVTGARVTDAREMWVEVGGVRHEGRVILAAPLPRDPSRERAVTLATLLVVAPELDAAPRGTGLLVDARARGVRARALTHVSAKWSWIAQALPAGHHVVRLSYDGAAQDLEEQAIADAERLLGVRFASVDGSAFRSWHRPLGADTAPGGIPLLGERASGTGLASVLPHAERTVSALLTDIPTERTHP